MKKILSILISTFLIMQVLPVEKLFAAEGPAQPEAAQFEPVDTTDMVNLYTGNFSYNLPLLEVPGPEGNWPINMSYHAGIGPNTEATWVGLGWTLNPGAINRFVSGYPDDYYNGFMESNYEMHKDGWGLSLGVYWGPVGMSIDYNTFSGVGVNASLSLVGLIRALTQNEAVANAASQVEKANKNSPLNLDLSLEIGTSGIGLSTYVGLSTLNKAGIGTSIGLQASIHSSQKPNYSVKGGVSYSKGIYDEKGKHVGANSLNLLGCSYSFSGGGANGTMLGTGFSSNTFISGEGSTTVTGGSAYIPIGIFIGRPELGISLGFHEIDWWLREKHIDRSYGFLHQLSFLLSSENPTYTIDQLWSEENGNIINDVENYLDIEEIDLFHINGTDRNGWELYDVAKFERNVMNDNLVSSTDVYSVSAQGLGGIFSPYVDKPYEMIDNSDQEQGNFNTLEFGGNTGANVKFRFTNDTGRNFIPMGSSELGIDQCTDNRNNYGSKKIEPAIDLESGLIMGFRVTEVDGRIYEFFRPVFSYFEYTKSEKDGLKNEAFRSSPYATSWLLTAIKGPDYVDRSVNNIPNGFSSDDWGFWVKFSYEINENPVTWRTPFKKGTWTNTPDDTDTYSLGLKQNVYLKSIETATHLAQFNTSFRSDNKSADSELFYRTVTTNFEQWIQSDEHTIAKAIVSFNFDKQDLIDKVGQNDFNITLKAFYGNPNLLICQPSGTWLFSDVDSDDGQDTYSVNMSIADIPDLDDNDNLWTFNTDLWYPGEGHNALWNGYVACCRGSIVSISMDVITDNSSADFAKKLDKIEVKKKILNDEKKTDYVSTFSSDCLPMEAIVFDYDYSLMKGAENSDSNENNTYGDTGFYGDGKLTLVSATRLGYLENTQALPSTNFSYNNSESWGQYKWDLWNGYTSVGTSESHYNSQDELIANQDAGMWKLKKISTALGSDITIGYESDVVHKIADNENLIFASSLQNEYEISPNRDGDLKIISYNTDDMTNISSYLSKNRKFFVTSRFNTGLYNAILEDYYYDSAFDECYGPPVYVWQETYSVICNEVFEGDIIRIEVDETDFSFNDFENFLSINVNVPVSEIIYFVNGFRFIRLGNSFCPYDYVPPGLVWERDHNDNFIDDTCKIGIRIRDEFVSTSTLPRLVNVQITNNSIVLDEQLTDFVFANGVYTTKSVLKYFLLEYEDDYVYMGGSRVASICIEDKNIQKRTQFDYGSGILTILPNEYSNNFKLNNDLHIDFKKVCNTIGDNYLINEGYNLLGPSPCVGYESVTVTNYNSFTNETPKGKTVHTFITSEDYNLSVSETDTEVLINDYSGIIGSPKTVSIYKYLENDEYVIQLKNSYLYNFSSSLTNLQDIYSQSAFNRNIYDKSYTYPCSLNAKLGYSQQMYVSKNTVETENGDEVVTKSILHNKENVFLVGNVSETYFYDENNDLISTYSTETNNIGYDAYTGNVIMSVTSNSKNEVIVDEKTPAYWIGDYSAIMTQKNMLSQTAQTKGFKLPPKSDPEQNLGDYVFSTFDANNKNDYLMASGVQTWSNQFDINSDGNLSEEELSIMRMNDSYKFIANANEYEDFNGWSGDPGNFVYSNTDKKLWKRTSNIERYDRYNHPLEEKNIDDTYTCALYNSDDALPIAIVSNARYEQVRYFDFEQINSPTNYNTDALYELSNNVKTGVGFSNVNNGVLQAGAITAPEDDSVSKYKATYWYKPAGMNSPSNFRFIVEKLDPGETLVFSQDGTLLSGVVDDVRIYPENARMSTYVYHPLTDKLMSITDDNSITTYFEYDQAGRLTVVRDQDRSILSIHEYNYARDAE
ncbi:MAG: hypothetical protein PHR06_05210 [Candidatus Cloacimonetes bacterium]|nr:hypothetical protein [Candidatus Cloacimonadota bacterium]